MQQNQEKTQIVETADEIDARFKPIIAEQKGAILGAAFALYEAHAGGASTEARDAALVRLLAACASTHDTDSEYRAAHAERKAKQRSTSLETSLERIAANEAKQKALIAQRRQFVEHARRDVEAGHWTWDDAIAGATSEGDVVLVQMLQRAKRLHQESGARYSPSDSRTSRAMLSDRRATVSAETAFPERPVLIPVQETRLQRIVNDQRRSNGGVIRIESGSGR